MEFPQVTPIKQECYCFTNIMPFKDKVKRAAYGKKYQEEHREKCRKLRMRSYYKNRDKELKQAKEYQALHKEEYNFRSKQWAIDNPERNTKMKKAYRNKNKKILKEKRKVWYQKVGKYIPKKNNKEYHIEYRRTHVPQILFNNKLRTDRFRGAVGHHSYKDWEELKKYYYYTCPICLRSEPEIRLTRDHIVPITKRGSNFIGNILPMCQSCNSKKHNHFLIQLKKEYSKSVFGA